MKRGLAVALVVVLVVAFGAGIFALFLRDDSSKSTAPATTTSTYKFSGAGGQAFCTADEQLNQSVAQQAPKATDPTSLQADYQRRVQAVRQLEQVAPAEIKGDVTTIRGAYEALGAALATVGYDANKLSTADKAKIQTPEVQKAGDRLNQYDANVCKLGAQGAAP